VCHPAHWVALGHPSLDFGRAAQRIHHTAELDAKPTACRLDQPDAVRGDCPINEHGPEWF
jgi:hypothetical protein